MAEPTLSLKYGDLLAEVGFFLGFGRGSALGDVAWTTRQQTTLDYIVASGLRQFYYPPPLPGSQSSYDWSFLKPTATLTLSAGSSTVTLPDDYGGLDGKVTVLTSATVTQPWRIEWENEGRIRQRFAMAPSTTTAIPRMMNTRVNGFAQPTSFSCSAWEAFSCCSQRRGRSTGKGGTESSGGSAPSRIMPRLAAAFCGSNWRAVCKQYRRSLGESTTALSQTQHWAFF